MNDFELFLLKWTGKLIGFTGFGGLCLCVMFDYIARGIPRIIIGPLQMAGFIVFILIIAAGFILDKLLNRARIMIEDYLKS